MTSPHALQLTAAKQIMRPVRTPFINILRWQCRLGIGNSVSLIRPWWGCKDLGTHRLVPPPNNPLDGAGTKKDDSVKIRLEWDWLGVVDCPRWDAMDCIKGISQHWIILDGHTIVYSGRPTQGMSRVEWPSGITGKSLGHLSDYEPIQRPTQCCAIQRETTKHYRYRYSDKSVWTMDQWQ